MNTLKPSFRIAKVDKEYAKDKITENEGIRVLIKPDCPLCQSSGKPFYKALKDPLYPVPGKWDIMHCADCYHSWLSTCPFIDEFSKIYPDYHTHTVPLEVPSSFFSTVKSWIKDNLLAAGFGYGKERLGLVSQVLFKPLSWFRFTSDFAGGSVMWLEKRPSGRLLDIGCGRGDFLVKMKKLGWQVAGTDFDPQAVGVCSERLQVSIHNGALEDAGFSDSSFDAITMSHVIEHLPQPELTLKECTRLLAPGGLLVITTPNFESWGRRIFGQHWRGLEIPRHIHFFTTRSLRTYLETAGLHVTVLRTSSRSAREFWFTSREIQKNRKIYPKLDRSLGILFQIFELFCELFIERGEEILAIARKEISTQVH